MSLCDVAGVADIEQPAGFARRFDGISARQANGVHQRNRRRQKYGKSQRTANALAQPKGGGEAEPDKNLRQMMSGGEFADFAPCHVNVGQHADAAEREQPTRRRHETADDRERYEADPFAYLGGAEHVQGNADGQRPDHQRREHDQADVGRRVGGSKLRRDQRRRDGQHGGRL
jgi:hypothetical protein